MRGECNRKSKGAGGRGEGSKGQGGATEPKAQKSLGAKDHDRWRHHAETAKALTFCALWRGKRPPSPLPRPSAPYLLSFSLASPCIRLHRLFPLCIPLHPLASPEPAFRGRGVGVSGRGVGSGVSGRGVGSGCRLSPSPCPCPSLKDKESRVSKTLLSFY